MKKIKNKRGRWFYLRSFLFFSIFKSRAAFSCLAASDPAFDVQKYLHGNSADKRKVLIEILKFIDDNELKYFHQLQHYCIYHEKYDWLDVINYSNTMSIKATIQSQWQKARDEKLADNSEEGQLARTVEAKKELKQRVKALAEKGKTRKEIADKFNISVRTVKRYVNDN